MCIRDRLCTFRLSIEPNATSASDMAIYLDTVPEAETLMSHLSSIHVLSLPLIYAEFQIPYRVQCRWEINEVDFSDHECDMKNAGIWHDLCFHLIASHYMALKNIHLSVEAVGWSIGRVADTATTR